MTKEKEIKQITDRIVKNHNPEKYFFSGLLRGGIRTKTLNRYYIISRYPGAAIEIFGMDETKKSV